MMGNDQGEGKFGGLQAQLHGLLQLPRHDGLANGPPRPVGGHQHRGGGARGGLSVQQLTKREPRITFTTFKLIQFTEDDLSKQAQFELKLFFFLNVFYHYNCVTFYLEKRKRCQWSNITSTGNTRSESATAEGEGQGVFGLTWDE